MFKPLRQALLKIQTQNLYNNSKAHLLVYHHSTFSQFYTGAKPHKPHRENLNRVLVKMIAFLLMLHTSVAKAMPPDGKVLA